MLIRWFVAMQQKRDAVIAPFYGHFSLFFISGGGKHIILFGQGLMSYRGGEHGCVWCGRRLNHTWVYLSKALNQQLPQLQRTMLQIHRVAASWICVEDWKDPECKFLCQMNKSWTHLSNVCAQRFSISIWMWLQNSFSNNVVCYLPQGAHQR